MALYNSRRSYKKKQSLPIKVSQLLVMINIFKEVRPKKDILVVAQRIKKQVVGRVHLKALQLHQVVKLIKKVPLESHLVVKVEGQVKIGRQVVNQMVCQVNQVDNTAQRAQEGVLLVQKRDNREKVEAVQKVNLVVKKDHLKVNLEARVAKKVAARVVAKVP